MASKVTFNNTSGQLMFVEAGKTGMISTGVPEVFDNGFDGHAKLTLLDSYGQFFIKGDASGKPIMYFRHTDIGKNQFRFGNLVDLGDHYLSYHKGVYHAEEVAQADTPLNGYRQIKEGVYGFDSEEKFMEERIYEDHVTIKEGDFFDVKFVPWGPTFFDHQTLYPNSSVIFQPCMIIGEFDGQPVVGFGSFDRFCVSNKIRGFDNVQFGYIALGGAGMRADGRKEQFSVNISLTGDGKVYGMYYLEGERPVFADCVTMEAVWEHLPYVDDGTCVYKDAVIGIGSHTIHFNGKWGAKGFLKEPRLDKHGQSQIFGTWYEGDISYDHKLFFTFGENMEAYDYNLKKLGFDVKENISL